MALSARFEYPGIPVGDVISAAYSLGHGITPGVITVEVPAGQSYPRQEGDAVFWFGSVSIRIEGCKFDAGTSRIGSGQIWTFSILDGRWPWQFGKIIGHYNLRTPDGKIKVKTEKTPQELAILCLKAMKVSNYDVSKMENTRRPEVHWSYANPAQSLAALADEVGCRVVYGVNRSVKLLPAGEGADLPDLAAQSIDLAVDTAQLPSAILVVGAESLFQTRWSLEPVGLSTTGTWMPIDELPYMPSGGWGGEDPNTFSTVKEVNDHDKPNPRALAQQTVWRCYRIKTPKGDGKFPGFDKPIGDYRKALPLTSGLIDIQQNNGSDLEGVALERKPRPPIVRGDYFETDWKNKKVEGKQYKGTISVDGPNGIIQFDRPVYLFENGRYKAADLVVEIAHPLRREDRELERPTWNFKLTGDSKIGEKVLITEDLKYTCKIEFDKDNNQTGVKENRASEKLDDNAEYVAKTFLASLSTVRSADRLYPGIIDIKTDGAISQVSWTMGRGPAMTRASRNSEHDCDIIPPYKDRRRREDLADGAQAVKMFKAKNFNAGGGAGF